VTAPAEVEAEPAPEAAPDEAPESPEESSTDVDSEGFSRSHLADHFDPTDVPRIAWRILKDPDDGIAQAHMPGAAAFLHGVLLGGFSVLLIAGLRIAAWPFENGVHQELGTPAGGLLFLGVGGLVSFLLRMSIGKVKHADWHDDVFLLGGSMLYAAVACLIAYPLGKVYDGMGAAVSIVGLLLAAISHYSGVMDLGKVVQGRAIFITVIVFTVAMTVSAWMGFLPYLSYEVYPLPK
jgi:hypothetical protein